MKALLLTILLSYSCTKYAPLSKDALGLKFSEVEMEVSHLNEIDWVVGKGRDAKVSQSFVFIVNLPKADEEDLEHLTKLKGIDSWILRLIVQRRSEKQDLGSLYTLFKPKTVGRGQTGGPPTTVSLKVFYAASYASERFRSFHCPAFEHTRRITDMKISGENSKFDISIDLAIPYPEKSHLVELAPSAFNGGNSVVGEYFIEIAPYDSEKKIIHGAFKRIPRYVQIIAEEKVPLPSCTGVHEELQ